MSAGRIILVDDEPEVREAYRQTLELEGYEVADLGGASEALSLMDGDTDAVLVSDVRMSGMDGFGFLEAVRRIDPDIPFVLVTGHGDIAMAMRAVRLGAYDFIEKPADPEHLIDVVRRALDHRALVLENRRLKRQLHDLSPLEARLIGRSAAMERLRAKIAALADTDADVLIHGETGTGKEVVARCLHDLGKRSGGEFVALNCGALPETILESELFGHEKGAYTGAGARRIGKFEHADGGTLFLDEIESMPMAAQVRLLRVLQERVVEPLGSNTSRPIDIRVIAATKADLQSLAREGGFRLDLFYRLNVVTLDLPALRERREDIPLLYAHFGEQASRRHDRAPPPLDPDIRAELAARDWPGNVRELRNAAERAVLGFGESPAEATPAEAGDLARRVDAFERQVLEECLAQCGGRIGEAAERLGITRKTLYLKMRKHGLRREGFLG